MHFMHTNDGAGGRIGKFTLVAGLHALMAMGVIHTMNAKTLSLPALLDEPLVWIKPELPPPTPPAQPPQPQTSVAPPEVVVPKVEVDVPEAPPEPVVQASIEAEPALPAPTEAPAQPAAQSAAQSAAQPAAQPSANSGQMRNAVLADANGCAKPEYPARAARNGETGTVTLALLVGADGRVQQSRIQSSSGSRELDRAAVGALSMCQFQPAMNNGIAEPGWAQIAYVWTLE